MIKVYGRSKEPLRRRLIGRRRRTELDVAGFSIADVGSGGCWI
jgi:hypothetical protein